MSIETIGPERYAWQYEATVWLYLELRAQLRSLVVEPEGGEDLQLEIYSNSGTWTLEVQAKSELSDIDLDFISDVLFHFPRERTDNPLIDRIRNDERRIAVLVCGGRCVDSVRRCAKRFPASLEPAQSTQVDAESIRAFQRALMDTSRMKDPGNLAARRKEYRAKYKLNQPALFSLSRKLHIFEGITSRTLRESSVHALARAHVPQSRAPEAFNSLVKLVQENAKSRTDILATLNAELSRNRADRAFIRPVHVDRFELQESLLRTILHKRILLLRGHQHCGKTHMAEWIGGMMQDRGYQIEKGTEPESAARYLNSTLTDSRIFIIEDPFDNTASAEAAVSILRRIRALCAGLRQHRGLIITSRNEHLQRWFSPQPFQSIDTHTWIDLTLTDPATSITLWRAYAAENSLTPESRHEGETIFSITSHPFQPGQVRHLAFNFPLSSDIEHRHNFLQSIARFNTNDVAYEMGALSDPREISMLAALAVSATHNRRVRTQELAVMISDPKDYTPAIRRPETIAISYSFDKNAPPDPFPSYPPSAKLTQQDRVALQRLESRGWIIRGTDEVKFAHPDYWDGALKMLIWRDGGFDSARNFTRILCTGLDAYAAITAIESIRCLTSMNSDPRQAIRQCCTDAFVWLDSINPGVADASLMFLLRNIAGLTDEEKEKVFRAIQRSAHYDSFIAWHEGAPYFNSRSQESLFHDWELEEQGNAAISSPVSEITTVESAWIRLHGQPNRAVILRCLDFDEVFIRSLAVAHLVPTLTMRDSDLLLSLMEDHPRVVASILERCMSCWSSLPEDIRAITQDALARAVSNPSVALLARRLIWNADDERHHANNSAKWSFLGPLIVSIFEADVQLDRGLVADDKVDWVTDWCAPHLTCDLRERLAAAWYSWIISALHRRLPPGGAINIADFAISHLSQEQEVRRRILCSSLTCPDTGFACRTIRTMTTQWDMLSAREKIDVLDALCSHRVDVDWLRAAAATSSNVPHEVWDAILNISEDDEVTAHVAISNMSSGLLSKCLHTYHGVQPMWWLELQYKSRNEIWRQASKLLRSQPDDPLFTLLWERELSFERRESLPEWSQLCSSLPLSYQRLLCLTLKSVGKVNDNYSEHWVALWSILTDENKHWLADDVSRHSDKYCQYDSLQDQLPRELVRMVYKRLPLDCNVQSVCFQHMKGSLAAEDLISLARDLYDMDREGQATATLIKDTHDIVVEALRAAKAPDELIDRVWAARREKYEHESIELSDWIRFSK